MCLKSDLSNPTEIWFCHRKMVITCLVCANWAAPICMCPKCQICSWVEEKCSCGGDGNGDCGACVWYQTEDIECSCGTENCCAACQWAINNCASYLFNSFIFR